MCIAVYKATETVTRVVLLLGLEELRVTYKKKRHTSTAAKKNNNNKPIVVIERKKKQHK